MIDVIVIGGGPAGTAIAQEAIEAGLQVAVVEECCPKPPGWEGEWIEGHASLYASGLVAILDPKTGDERRLIQSCAIVLAVGIFASDNPGSRMLGISKLGLSIGSENHTIETNAHGQTRARGIFATGSCASSSTPHLLQALLQHCSAPLPGKTN